MAEKIISFEDLPEWEPFTFYETTCYVNFEGELSVYIPGFHNDIPIKIKDHSIITNEISLETD